MKILHKCHFTRVAAIGICTLVMIPSIFAKLRCPTDLNWLKGLCGDGALAHEYNGQIYLTELSTGRTEGVGKGDQPEFSPDSSKLAWLHGSEAKGRLRQGDTTIYSIATNVDRRGGIHWVSNTEVVVLVKKDQRKIWYRISLSGVRTELPQLKRLGTARRETDVKLGKDGVWSYVSDETWKTSDGSSGHIGGNCSASLSPDGRSVTGLQGDHRRCRLTAIRPGGVDGWLQWKYDGTFDNHRWSSNDPRFIVCEDEKYKRMVVMEFGTGKATHLGKKGEGDPEKNMYGDFTVGNGKGKPWPKQEESPTSKAPTESAWPSKMVVLANTWPGNVDGLIFLWENRRKPNEIFDDEAQTPRYCNGRLRGLAKFDRYHAMDLTGGTFEVQGIDQMLLEACLRTNQLALEAVVTTETISPELTCPIITFSSEQGSGNFTLVQKGDNLVFHLRTSKTDADGTKPETTLYRIDAGQPNHIVVAYHPGRLVCYVNGKRVFSTVDVVGNFSNWSAQRLLFGGEWGGKQDWAGQLEGIAIYNRFLSPEEAKHNYAHYAKRLKARQPVARFVVRARLREKTQMPTIAKLQEYARALVVHTYDVQNALKGDPDSGRILVAHWVFLDRQPVLSIDEKRVGQLYRLELERFDDNPQLESEMQFNDCQEFDLPFFYDVSPNQKTEGQKSATKL